MYGGASYGYSCSAASAFSLAAAPFPMEYMHLRSSQGWLVRVLRARDARVPCVCVLKAHRLQVILVSWFARYRPSEVHLSGERGRVEVLVCSPRLFAVYHPHAVYNIWRSMRPWTNSSRLKYSACMSMSPHSCTAERHCLVGAHHRNVTMLVFGSRAVCCLTSL